MPTLSVLMVFHRDSPFLRPAIESVFRQTWADLELVLVDNGTGLTAGSLGPSGADPRLRWVRLARNEGIPAGHNAGVAAARGEFIALLDYDDIALPRRFERQIALLRREPRLGLVSSLAETIDVSGRVVGPEFALVSSEEQRAYTQFAAPVVTPAYTGRRELFERFAYRAQFPYAADFDFLARAAEVSDMAAVEEPLLQYRRHPQQATQQYATMIEENCCAIRLLTARRRADQPENLEFVAGAMAPKATPAESCRRWSRRCLDEGFATLAGFHARRAVALQRSPVSACRAIMLAGKAVVMARGAERRLALKMFLKGPVRALQLHPVAVPSAGPAGG